MSIEKIIKEQYAKIFTREDYCVFLKAAEYYLHKAAFLKKSDVDVEEALQLWLRNVQKRLFLGVGIELLLKSIYLKLGYTINKHQKSKRPEIIQKHENIKINEYDTFTIAQLIDDLGRIHTFSNISAIKKGLNIAKVFRNKEGHVVTLWHNFDTKNGSHAKIVVS